jgi:hypothetical protein
MEKKMKAMLCLKVKFTQQHKEDALIRHKITDLQYSDYIGKLILQCLLKAAQQIQPNDYAGYNNEVIIKYTRKNGNTVTGCLYR